MYRDDGCVSLYLHYLGACLVDVGGGMIMDVKIGDSPAVHAHLPTCTSYPSHPPLSYLIVTPPYVFSSAGIAPKGAPVGADGRPRRVQSERECLARYYHKVTRWRETCTQYTTS